MKDIRTCAVNYLNVKPRTGSQVVKYLHGKGFEDDEIYETVKELEEYHYIDDLNYSIMYFQYGFEKGRGIARIKRELAEKGVASDMIEAAYEELEDVPDQYEAAYEIAENMVKGTDISELGYDEMRRLKAKIGRRLTGRGFSYDVVYKVIDDLK